MGHSFRGSLFGQFLYVLPRNSVAGSVPIDLAKIPRRELGVCRGMDPNEKGE